MEERPLKVLNELRLNDIEIQMMSIAATSIPSFANKLSFGCSK